MPDSLQPHGLQHARLPCPSPSPRACSNSCPSIQSCHPIISSSVVPFSSSLQSSPASGSSPMSQFFTLRAGPGQRPHFPPPPTLHKPRGEGGCGGETLRRSRFRANLESGGGGGAGGGGTLCHVLQSPFPPSRPRRPLPTAWRGSATPTPDGR